MTYEGLRLKLLKIRRDLFAESRKKKLKQTDFTIISNNCWGGMIYESYNLEKKSPTVGLFIMAEDYIKFLKRLKEYINAELKFISPYESKYVKKKGNDDRFGSYPIGVLTLHDESIEIFFLHYHSEQEAKEKWERRCKRINWDKLLIKCNDQNGFTEQDIKHWNELPYPNKLFFTSNRAFADCARGGVCIKQFPKHDYIMASYEPFGKNRYIDINNLINNL